MKNRKAKMINASDLTDEDLKKYELYQELLYDCQHSALNYDDAIQVLEDLTNTIKKWQPQKLDLFL